jgi:hypothetical protein
MWMISFAQDEDLIAEFAEGKNAEVTERLSFTPRVLSGLCDLFF